MFDRKRCVFLDDFEYLGVLVIKAGPGDPAKKCPECPNAKLLSEVGLSVIVEARRAISHPEIAVLFEVVLFPKRSLADLVGNSF